MAGVGAILNLGLGLMQYSQQKKAANERKKANQIANRASIRQALRETQIKSAQMRAYAQFAGVSQGTYSNTLMSQFGRTAGDAGMISQHGEKAMQHEMNASLLGLFGNFASGLGGGSQPSGSGMGGSNVINVGQGTGGYSVYNPAVGWSQGYGFTSK